MNYRVTLPIVERIPILLSIPHCGTDFPHEIRNEYVEELIEAPDDTDWFVDQLYGFAPSLGITVISAVWSRWVIDLNRHPESKPLYTDGRIITDLCPLTTFLGRPIYRDGRTKLDDEEIKRRRQLYFDPYHEELQRLLMDLRSQFGTVLLWDCHSIRQIVPTIQQEKFPDLILGSADEKSSDPMLIESALNSLGKGSYNLHHNYPFKGGFITRRYGVPQEHQHALQLEMTKVNYMDDAEIRFHPGRAKKMGELLFNTLSSLSGILISVKD